MGRLLMIVILVAGWTAGLADVGQAASGRTTELSVSQQRQYQECLDAILHLQAEIRALSEAPSRPEPAMTVYAKHRSPIRLAAISVRKCHAEFVRSLSPEQQTAMKQALNRMSKSLSAIQRHLLTLDDDLYQHSLDNGRFMLHVQGLQRSVDEYLERYRRIPGGSAGPPTISSMIGAHRSRCAFRDSANIVVVASRRTAYDQY